MRLDRAFYDYCRELTHLCVNKLVHVPSLEEMNQTAYFAVKTVVNNVLNTIVRHNLYLDYSSFESVQDGEYEKVSREIVDYILRNNNLNIYDVYQLVMHLENSVIEQIVEAFPSIDDNRIKIVHYEFNANFDLIIVLRVQ